MQNPAPNAKPNPRPIRNLRWWIAGLLFASTVINYIDRQTLAVLSPYLKEIYHWTNSDYANLLIGFRITYTVGQTVCGRLMDRVGTRRGLTLSVLFYSIVSISTSLARGFYSFAAFRFLLGAGESANWPGATKAVSEWFPKQERAFATAFFDSGSSIGGAVAPFLILPIYFRWGWRAVFVIPGVLGLFWLLIWRKVYHLPLDHPHLSSAEREHIVADAADPKSESFESGHHWMSLLKFPQTWGSIIARTFTDPVWFFIVEWLPIYLKAKGISSSSALIAIWIPFIAADLGNLSGGAASGYLIKHGWSLGAARKAIVIFGACGMLLLIPTIATVNLWAIIVLFALATFCYGTFTTIANVLPSDLFKSDAVASVSGMGGTGAGIGTIIAFKLIGYFSDANQSLATHSFDSIIIVAGLVPFVGMLLVLWLVRNTSATEKGIVRPI